MKKKDWTVLEMLNWTTGFFKKKNIKEPKLDAEVLLSAVLKIKRLDLYLNFDRILKISETNNFKNFIKKRIEGFPVAYILQEKEFMGYKFKVTENVLIPRPETEILVESILEFFEKNFLVLSENKYLTVVDVCTGSGNIPISISQLLHKHKNSIFFYGTDISLKALKIAQQNIYDNRVANNIRLLLGDLLTPLEIMPLKEKISLIISNPPYIKTHDLDKLDIEVRKEPKLALDGGDDGLFFYKKIIDQSKKFLHKNGYIFFEIDPDLKEEIIELLKSQNFYDIMTKKDYQNLDRVIIAKRG